MWDPFEIITQLEQSTIALFGMASLASFVGSLHCVSMCGCFVALLGNSKSRITSYHLGRLTGYLGLGLLAGILGASIFGYLTDYNLAQYARVLMASVFIATAILLLMSRMKRLSLQFSFLSKLMSGILKKSSDYPVLGGFGFGILTPLLPCGWLYLFVFAAISSGSAISGTALLFGFWVGTLPALLLGSRLLLWLSPRLKGASRIVLAGLFILLGWQSLSHRSQFEWNQPTPQSGSVQQENCH